MRRWLSTVAVLALTASAQAAAPPLAEGLARFRQFHEAGRLNGRGMALYWAGRWSEATSVFAEVLRISASVAPITGAGVGTLVKLDLHVAALQFQTRAAFYWMILALVMTTGVRGLLLLSVGTLSMAWSTLWPETSWPNRL